MVESVVQSPAEIVVGSSEKLKIRVLHVDDELGLLKVAKQCLEMQGPFHVDTACSVEEALAKLGKEKYNVIVSDYQMPGKDGLEFLKELREKENAIPFIMFTGKGREEVAIKALNLGANQYLNKVGEAETVYTELAHSIRELAKTTKTEEKMHESEQKFRNLFDKANDGLVFVDLSGRIVDINQKAAEIAGKRKEDIVGKSFLDLALVNPKDVPVLVEKLEHQTIGKQAGLFEFEIGEEKGEKKLIEISSTLIQKNSMPAGSLAIVRDITERKKAEEALRESEEKLKAILSSSPDAIAVFDLDGNVVELNQAAMALHNFSEKKEIIGKSSFDFVSPRDLHKARETFKRTLEQGCVKNSEFKLLTKEGQEFLVELSAGVVPDAFDRPSYIVAVIKDITERRKAESALFEKQTRLENVLAASPDAITLVDLKGTIIEANQASADLYGYSSRKELIGKNALDFVAKKDYQKAMENMKKTIEQGQTRNLVYTLVTKQGHETQVEVAANVARDASGIPSGFVAVVRDNTERKRAKEAMVESEEKYRDLVELAPDGIVAVNAEGIVTSANRSFLTLVGYDSVEEGIVGKPFTELMTMRMEDIPRFQGMFMSLMKGESPSPSEFLCVRRDGTSRWAEVQLGLLIRDGNPVGVQAIMRDVTERKNAEKLVQESQQKFEALFRGNPEAAVYVDLDLRILDVNPRFCQLFGYPAEEVMRKKLIEVIVPEDLLEEAERLNRDSKKGYARHETIRKRKDGSQVHVSISAAPVACENKPLGYVGIYKDITGLKKAEERLEELNKRLEVINEKLHVVGGLTRHDVRNKMSVVTGNAYLLKRKLAEDPEALEQLADMEKAVRDAEAIFEFARAYEKLGVEQLVNMNVGKVVAEAASLFPDLKGIRLVNECNGLTVLADSLLQQLFYNLIDNSLKHGKKLSQIRIHYEKAEEKQLRLVYEDDGVGIGLDAKTKIFNEGYTTGKGSGYGLYLAKRLMEVYGWTIQETGTPGKGAHFTMVIPEKRALLYAEEDFWDSEKRREAGVAGYGMR